MKKKISFLGHVISEQGVSTDLKKIKDVEEWPVPKNVSTGKGDLEVYHL